MNFIKKLAKRITEYGIRIEKFVTLDKEMFLESKKEYLKIIEKLKYEEVYICPVFRSHNQYITTSIPT